MNRGLSIALVLVATSSACIVVQNGETPVAAGQACNETATVDWCSGDTLTYCSVGWGWAASCSGYCGGLGYAGAACRSQPGDDVCECFDTIPAVVAGVSCDSAATVDGCAADGDQRTYCGAGLGRVESCNTWCLGQGRPSGYCQPQPGDDACVCG